MICCGEPRNLTKCPAEIHRNVPQKTVVRNCKHQAQRSTIKHTNSTEAAVGGVAETDVKAFGCGGVKVVAASGTTVLPDAGAIMANMLVWAAVGDKAKLFGWTGCDIGMDGCDKSRSPRRSTLLAGAVLAVDAGAAAGTAAGGSDVACIGGTGGGTAADSNGWKSPPLGLQSRTTSREQIFALPTAHTSLVINYSLCRTACLHVRSWEFLIITCFTDDRDAK